MTTRSAVVGRAINSYLTLRRAKYSAHRVRRVLTGRRRRLTFYYRLDDPYSHLLTQVAPRLTETFDLEVALVPVATPSAAAHPEPDLLRQHAIRDAAVLAESYGLSFPQDAVAPSQDRIRRGHAVLLVQRPAAEQIEVARALGEAVWRDDGKALAALVDAHGAVSGESVRPQLAQNYARLEQAGHYQPGMLHYEGEWYWGIDRLVHLQSRLQKEGLEGELGLHEQPSRILAARVNASNGAERELENFFSFRSPYSYLALPRVATWPEAHGVTVRLRPVLPMVMRGLAVPRVKRLYIVQDAKREADRLHIPFGRVCDPLGRGIGHCLAVFFHCAAPQGVELAFSISAMRGIWAEARDMSTIRDLVYVAERAGISASDVKTAREDSSWKQTATENREALTEIGLWGVPSFRLGSYVTWGQDRLSLMEAALAQAQKAA